MVHVLRVQRRTVSYHPSIRGLLPKVHVYRMKRASMMTRSGNGNVGTLRVRSKRFYGWIRQTAVHHTTLFTGTNYRPKQMDNCLLAAHRGI